MTQLDRLEALVEKWKEPGKRWYGIATVNKALPDLIRVARATEKYMKQGEGPNGEYWFEVQRCLSGPLFSEVESVAGEAGAQAVREYGQDLKELADK